MFETTTPSAHSKGGLDAAFVLGNPDFYKRFGFVPAAEHQLSNEYGAGDEFMVCELSPGVLDRITGLVQYGPEFQL